LPALCPQARIPRSGRRGLEPHQGRHSGADVRRGRGGLAEPATQEEEPAEYLEVDLVLEIHDSGVIPMPEVMKPIFDEINEKYGTNIEPIFK
jgi:hypothetical protein